MAALQRGFAKVGCAVDFSDASRYAVGRASDIARRFGAELTLVHVVEPRLARGAVELANGGGTAEPTGSAPEQTLAGAIEAWRVEAEGMCGSSVDSKLLAGDPAVEILQLAREREFDLLVVGSDDRSALQGSISGPVAGRIVREAPCAVLVARRRPLGEIEIDIDDEELHQYQAV
jgi:nucleotide-binding universal stress UspA family protein